MFSGMFTARWESARAPCREGVGRGACGRGHDKAVCPVAVGAAPQHHVVVDDFRRLPGEDRVVDGVKAAGFPAGGELHREHEPPLLPVLPLHQVGEQRELVALHPGGKAQGSGVHAQNGLTQGSCQLGGVDDGALLVDAVGGEQVGFQHGFAAAAAQNGQHLVGAGLGGLFGQVGHHSDFHRASLLLDAPRAKMVSPRRAYPGLGGTAPPPGGLGAPGGFAPAPPSAPDR